jgi:hypothetical protein
LLFWLDRQAIYHYTRVMKTIGETDAMV